MRAWPAQLPILIGEDFPDTKMLKVNTVQTNFSAGELSLRLLGRSDIDRFQNGAEVLENFTVRHQGGIVRRLGTQYITSRRQPDSSDECPTGGFHPTELQCVGS